MVSGTSIGNVTLDHRFCDRSLPALSVARNDCFQGHNTSLAIPISRHFSDQYVVLVFNPADNVVMCPVDTPSQCHSHNNPDPDLSTISELEPGKFQINVGLFSSIQVKFRLTKSVRDTTQRCSLSGDELGNLFDEVNLRFYRVCNV